MASAVDAVVVARPPVSSHELVPDDATGDRLRRGQRAAGERFVDEVSADATVRASDEDDCSVS